MCVVATASPNKTIKIKVPETCKSPGKIQAEIDDQYDQASHCAERSAMPCSPGAECDDMGLTRREMLAGMALPGILSRGVEPVQAAVLAIKAAEAVLLLSQTHQSNSMRVSPAELIAAIYSTAPGREACRCGT